MEQDTPCKELAQSLLADYLAKFPNNMLLWKTYAMYLSVMAYSITCFDIDYKCRAIAIEVNLKHTREARWMYQQATNALPLCLSLWTDVSPLSHVKYLYLIGVKVVWFFYFI